MMAEINEKAQGGTPLFADSEIRVAAGHEPELPEGTDPLVDGVTDDELEDAKAGELG